MISLLCLYVFVEDVGMRCRAIYEILFVNINAWLYNYILTCKHDLSSDKYLMERIFNSDLMIFQGNKRKKAVIDAWPELAESIKRYNEISE